MTVSIIIPVYNTEAYLPACLESILSQVFSDFEVLLVDDGSTDGSGRICDVYAEKDPRVVVFHRENGGVCSARNCGIDNARGEFIVFVDADDYVTDAYLGHLMESDADMVVTGLQKFGAKNGVSMPDRRDDFGVEELASHWNTPPVMNYLYCYPVAKRFRTEIIQEHGIRFDESLFFSEDMSFNIQYYCHADSFCELPYADYMYRIMSFSRETKYNMSAANLINHFEHLETCLDSLYKRIGVGSLSFVRDDTNLRLLRKLIAFLMQDGISQTVFIQNVKIFREKDWADYMVGLLSAKKEKKVMREAIRFPLVAYWIENRLRHTVRRISRSSSFLLASKSIRAGQE